MTRHIRSAVLICGLVSSAPAVAASFDCAAPGLDGIAKVICSDPALSQVDADMGAAYQQLFFLRGTSALASQRKWIKRRSHCGPDATCLTKQTEKRLAELRAEVAEAQQEPELLGRLSAAWTKDDDLDEHQRQAEDSLGSCPRAALDLDAAADALVPKTYVRLKAIATHRCDAVVKVYLGCTKALEEPNASASWVGWNGKWFACEEWNERLVIEDRPSGHARLLADLGLETRTGNSGALFVPLAFTKSDRDLVLQAWMGSPGAGGGDTVYGDELMSRSHRPAAREIVNCRSRRRRRLRCNSRRRRCSRRRCRRRRTCRWRRRRCSSRRSPCN